jgi:hypothetical protein
MVRSILDFTSLLVCLFNQSSQILVSNLMIGRRGEGAVDVQNYNGVCVPQNSEDPKSITYEHHPGSRYGQRDFKFS